MNPQQAYSFILLALCIWREARGESLAAQQAVAWTIRNRTLKPGWWGRDWVTCVLLPFQYSSFNHNDPNAVKWPIEADPAWADCLTAASQVFPDLPIIPDPTSGATSYFDSSMDSKPPYWATDGSNIHTVDIGRLHFWRLA